MSSELLANHKEILSILQEERGRVPRTLELHLVVSLELFALLLLEVDLYYAISFDAAEFLLSTT